MTRTASPWGYDRDSHIGRLDKALDEARAEGWTVGDMKQRREEHLSAFKKVTQHRTIPEPRGAYNAAAFSRIGCHHAAGWSCCGPDDAA
jgi:hypothetical protein